jgi:hypothetical protein
VFSGGETEISQKLSGHRIFWPKIILEDLTRRPVSNEEYHRSPQATHSVPSETYETCELNDINGFLQHNNTTVKKPYSGQSVFAAVPCNAD